MKYIFLLMCSFAWAQQTNFVDFTTANAELTINAENKSVAGTLTYTFDVLKETDTIAIDAQNMTFDEVLLDKKSVPFQNTKKALLLVSNFKKGNYTLSFNYQCSPKQALYFVGSTALDNLQIWTQGQGKYTSHWFPSFDDVNEKVVFNLAVQFDKDYIIISNGILKEKIVADNKATCKYKMTKPMSSYLLMLAIGKFDKRIEFSKSKVPLHTYLDPSDSARFDWTYRYNKQLFDALEKLIGVPYPWEVYQQVPVRDFLYAGMENTTATIFNSRYVVDEVGFNDRSYTNVNAHELAHQWFGNLITAKSSTHHWLQEGFATYFALLAERELYGDDYFSFKLYESAQQLKFASRTDAIPVLNAKASSLTFYQKGAWALFVLHQDIGDEAFKKVIRNYLCKHAFQTVDTDDFFAEVIKVSSYDVKNFSKIWLESTAFDTPKSNELLSKNRMIQSLLEVEHLKKVGWDQKFDSMLKIMDSQVYYPVKEAVLKQLKNEKWERQSIFFTKALQSNDLQLRQVVAQLLPQFPASFREQYETLLQDASYQTQEIALLTLCDLFPENRAKYLDQSRNWVGFNDYNLRVLWLSLAITTPNYLNDIDTAVKELKSYASAKYEANIRLNALEKLIAFELIDEVVLRELVQATTHHMWQFSKFGRDSIRLLLKNEQWRNVFIALEPNLEVNEKAQLNRLLKEL